jgi:hypothetical protein
MLLEEVRRSVNYKRKASEICQFVNVFFLVWARPGSGTKRSWQFYLPPGQ